MAVVAMLDIPGFTTEQYDAILRQMDVVERPSPGIYLHVCAVTDRGLRIIELWDREEGFRSFIEERMFPAAAALNLQAEPTITVEPLHFLFSPRLEDIPQLVGAATNP